MIVRSASAGVVAGLVALSVLSGGSPASSVPNRAPVLATCFWEGPISTKRPTTRGFDGRNFNFPEESATYWLARFNLPAGSHLELTGRYPYARYISLNAYADGAPTDRLSDIAIAPGRGSTNPFVTGALRAAPKRGYTVRLVDAPRPSGEREPNTIYADPGGDLPIELAYRVYEPDPGEPLTGGTRLPRATLVAADGTRSSGESACEAINDPNREITIQTVPEALWETARSTPPCDPDTNPAYDPPRWERFFSVDYASLAVITDCTDAGRAARLALDVEPEGGFYSNGDSAYIFSHLGREFGPLLVVEGRLPRFPRTYEEPRRMPDGQVRFWSLCTGESRVTVRTPDCLADRQVLRRSGREYTIVVSRRADRPENATAGCGVAWLGWGARGDGAGDRDYGLLIMRNMLASRGFAQAIQRVPQPGEEAAVMGPYFPRSEYSTVAEFEARGCGA